MSTSTSPRALLTALFMILTLLSCALSAPLSAVMKRDVWVPTIIEPTSASTWSVGGTFLVTWDTYTFARAMQPESSPIAYGFALTDGEVEVTIPDDTVPGEYMIVLFGDSGNWSEEFAIDAAT
ncbi:hypothetical protein F4604DRAFT_1899231 [Suillus subluteus]|nr:hypothetical protein F4604DRAFT_1899231 [Suillus subluteus]